MYGVLGFRVIMGGKTVENVMDTDFYSVFE